MRKKLIITLIAVSMISVTLISCANDSKDSANFVDANNSNEVSTSIDDNKTESNLDDANKSETKSLIDSNIPTTVLFNDVFLKFADKVGINKFEEDKVTANLLSKYNIEIEKPTENILGNIKISDDKDDNVSLCYFPLNDKETLTLVSYNRNGYAITITNDIHKSKTVKYVTYDINATTKNKTVSNINELAKFMFVEIGDTSSKTNEKLEVFVDIKPIINGGKVKFDIETNLPNGTQLMLSLSGSEYYGQSKANVENGKISTETFSNKGEALRTGKYKLKISMPLPAIQSNSVRDIIGNTGERMTGELVQKSSSMDSYTIEKEINFSI